MKKCKANYYPSDAFGSQSAIVIALDKLMSRLVTGNEYLGISEDERRKLVGRYMDAFYAVGNQILDAIEVNYEEPKRTFNVKVCAERDVKVDACSTSEALKMVTDSLEENEWTTNVEEVKNDVE